VKKLFSFFLIFITLSGVEFQQCYAQKYAPKEYYLVDSLILEDLSNSHIKLIDSCLAIFHKSKEDTIRVKIINVIISECWDFKVWPKYNEWIYKHVLFKLKDKLSIAEKIFYKKTLLRSSQ